MLLREAADLLCQGKTKEKVEQELIDPIRQGWKRAELNLENIEELKKKGAWRQLYRE